MTLLGGIIHRDPHQQVETSRLRKMVERDPARPAYIQTVWGFGYVFVPDGEKRQG